MRNAFVGLLFIVALGFAKPAAAQVYYPGSVWTSTGTLSPVEKGNIISMTHAEQGIAVKGAEVFFQTTVTTDKEGYDWNRRFTNGGGLRFTQKVTGNGMIRFSAAYVRERRYTFERTMQGMVVSADAWFGWKQSPRPGVAQ